MKIIIIGPRSVGKTTVGNLLARKLKMKYFDFDEIIEKKLKGIDKHVEKYGADSYRYKERKILKGFLSKLPKKFVVSVGGGTIASQLKYMSKKNTKDLKKKGKIIYLSPSKTKKQALNILYKNEKKRMGDKDHKETKKLFELRKPIYEKIYDIKIITNGKSSRKIVDEIKKRLTNPKNI